MHTVTQINSTLCPYDNTHGRNWDFSEFETLGRDFVLAFARGFVIYIAPVTRSSAQSAYGTARDLLRFLVANRVDLTRLIAALQSDHTKAKATDWEEALALWRDDVVSRPGIKPLTKHCLIKNINALLRTMVSRGVIPVIVYLRSIPKASKSSRAVKCLAELHPVDAKEASRRILDECLSGAKGTAAELQAREDFLAALLGETGEGAVNTEEQAEAIFELNRHRLELLRSCASQEFKQWRDHALKGMRLIQECDLEFEEIAATIHSEYKYMRARSRALKALFPYDDKELALARLLKYFAEHPEYRGRTFKESRSFKFPSWFNARVAWLGGSEILQAYLFPAPELTTAVITIVLCDTGANVSVARTLPLNCMEDSTARGYKIITGNKMRAGGKLIVNELPINDPAHEVSCVDALQTYEMISERLRRRAPEKIAAQLFLQSQLGGSVRNITILRWRDWFRQFRNRHQELKTLNIESKMIRASVLLQASYANEAGIAAATAVGAHSSMATTWSYAAKFPNQVFWERQIRKFQALYQAVSIQDIEGAAEKLGLPPKQVEDLLGEAYRTGLGVVCIAPRAGLQPGSERGEVCTQLQNCPSCPNRIVVATEETLKDLILWNKHLELHRADWEQVRPERWCEVWLPWLVFTQVVIEQASRGRTAKAFNQAKVRAEEQFAAGAVNFPPLW